MFRTLAVRGLIVVALLMVSPAAAQVTTWDAARNFSGDQNPNSEWTYGWKASAPASLTAFPTYQATLAAYPDRDAWQDLGQGSLLGVYHNTVGVTGDIPTNMLLLQPDPLGALAVVEWTAPAAMSLHVQGMFQSLDSTASQVTIVSSISGTRFSGTVNSTTRTSSFGLFLNVAGGEKIDFVASGGAAGLNAVLSKLSMLGNATNRSIALTDTRLRLTDSTQQVGGAWTFSKQRFDDGFDTTFLFMISQLTGAGADGFAFVIQNASTNSLSGNGGSLGYDGIPASLAIEFDTFQNTQPGWNDPNGNHISVHTLGVNPNSAMETASLGSTTLIPSLKDSRWHVAHFHYAVQPQPQLSIYIDNLTTPVLQVAVNIVSKLQLTDGTAWVGFTGATGGLAEVHDVQNWHFLSYDLHPPVLSLPANMALEGNTAGGATVTYAASALDAVDGAQPVTCTPASGAVLPVGNTTVSCSSTDLSGNTGNGSFVVTVSDSTPPALVVPLSVSASAVDISGASVSYIATATDIVDGDIVPACSPASGSTFALGMTAVTCIATDHAGNSASKNFQVSVTDQTAPVIGSLPDLQVEASGAMTAVTWPALTATDNVDGSIAVTCTPSSGSQFAVGSATVQCSATDAAGNVAHKNFKVTVQDTTAPAISGVPANLTLEATGPTGAAASWPSPTANDLVDGAVAVTCAPASGSVFPLGTTNVVCSAADAHGNQSSKQFSVTVQDTTAPVIGGMPSNLTVPATGPSGAVVTWPAPTASDLVDGALAVGCAPASGSLFPPATTTVVCSAADAHGNKSMNSFTVTVQAALVTPPTISCGNPDGLWHKVDVAIYCTARAGSSALANPADASFFLTTHVPAGMETSNASTNSRVVCDLAGNCSTAGPIAGNAVDKRAPAITIAAPANAVYLLHQPVAASYFCADAGSGTAFCSGPVANGAPIATGFVGTKHFTVKSSDNVGNFASESVRYRVTYQLCQVAGGDPKQPGATIPLRLALCDFAGKNVSSPALLLFVVGVDGPGGAMLGHDRQQPFFRYIGDRNGGGAYILELKTKGFAPGTHQLLVRVLGDPVMHRVSFTIRDGHQHGGNDDDDDSHRWK